MYNKGMTLVELTTGLAIAAVLLSTAVPAYRQMVQTQRQRVVASELVAALKMARTEAILRHRPVLVQSLDWQGWRGGWKVVVDATGKGVHDRRNPVLKVHPLDGSVIVTGNRWVKDRVRFDTLGGVAGDSGVKNNGTLFICPGDRRPAYLHIVLATSGRVRVDNKGVAETDPCLDYLS